MEDSKDKILIVDFGSQVTQLIARRVRETGVYSVVFPFNKIPESVKNNSLKGIILSGGPDSVNTGNTSRAPEWIFDFGIPVLGICYGQQTMVHQLGGTVVTSEDREFGRSEIDITNDCRLFKDVWSKGSKQQVWMSHGDSVEKLPDGFSVVAYTQNAPFAVIANEEKLFYGVQFHPEVYHSTEASKLIKNFLGICDCKFDWTMASFFEGQKKDIQDQVQSENVICGLSGGVDSSVVAILLHKIIGKQLTCIFVDNGLMRKNEAEQVVDLFREHYKIPLVHVDASKLFLDKLKNVKDPEKKRKIIGGLFIDVFEEICKKN